MKVVLISCVKTKQNFTCRASEMYTSYWFKSAYRYAQEQEPDKIFILSAKYGLLEPDDIIDTYEMKLSNKSNERKLWTERVIEKLCQKCDLQNDEFVILAGNAYRKYILQHIRLYKIPLDGMRQGEQISFFKHYFQGKNK